jgi:endo-1,4-beta-D-glucanase Y
MLEQVGRGKNLPFWDQRSDFMFNMSQWYGKDKYLVIAGATASAIVSVLAIWFTYFRIPALLGIVFWIFLLRGGVVIDFYIIPLIPIMALNIGLLLDYVFALLSNRTKVLYVLLSLAAVGIVVGVSALEIKPVLTTDETTQQINALTYIYTHIPKTSVLVVDAYGLVDLWNHGYTNAYFFWKLLTDPAIERKIRSDWQEINYVSLSHEMVITMKSRLGVPDILREAFTHSKEITSFGPSKNTYIDLPHYVSTNGDWSTLYKVEPTHPDMLGLSWKQYLQDFIKSGQVINPKDQITTSEGQSYALLRAVWMNDQTTFDTVWEWTKYHLQTRPNDHLLSWIYKNNTIVDINSASDADVDTALALLFASKEWKNSAYARDASLMLSDIWENEVAHIGSHYVLVSSADSKRAGGYLVNPSYFSPAHFRIFGQADTTHPWGKLSDDVYIVLDQIQMSSVYGKNMVLPPNWVFIQESGVILSAAPYNSSDVGGYGYDAFRTFYRLTLDSVWFGSPEAKKYLARAGLFFQTEWSKKKQLAALYDVQGHQSGTYQDISTPVGAFSALLEVDIQAAHQVYQTYFENTFQPDGVWGGGRLYFDQNWAWFAVALYKNAVPNLWAFQ